MISAVAGAGALRPAAESVASGDPAGGFADALDRAVRAVDATQHGADDGLRGVASGSNVDLHGTMIALEEANISLRAMTSVRDKAVEAYQAIWNMPI
jgi:flagellar hook-basal body complex protein FliE